MSLLDDTMSPLPSAVSTPRACSTTGCPDGTNKMLLVPCLVFVGHLRRKTYADSPRSSSTSQEPYDVFFLIYGATMVFFMQTGFALLEVGSGESRSRAAPSPCSTR